MRISDWSSDVCSSDLGGYSGSEFGGMTPEQQFRAVAAEKIMIFDGGYGTSIQKHGLTEADYRGSLDLAKDQKGNNDLLCLTRPDIEEGIHAAYLDAGPDMTETNTYPPTKTAMPAIAQQN